MVTMATRKFFLQNLFFQWNQMVLDEVEFNLGRRINLMYLFPLERCLYPTCYYMNLIAEIVETKCDPRVPNKSQIEEVSPTPSSTLLNASTKTPNPPSRRVLSPSTIIFSLQEIKPFLLLDELLEMKVISLSWIH